MTNSFFTLIAVMLLMAACVIFLTMPSVRTPNKHNKSRKTRIQFPQPPSGFPAAKPRWVKDAVLALHGELDVSHRKLADAFNRLYFAKTGISVGRTWVREMLKKHEHGRLHLQKSLKHRIPVSVARNAVWGIDTTFVWDAGGTVLQALGVVYHGSRRSIALQVVNRFNGWTFLGYLFLAIGQFGKPAMIKTDNHPVFHSRRVQRVLHRFGIQSTFSKPGKPWQNGRIERFFGTFKTALADYVIIDQNHLVQSLARFQFWYNVTRSHQHLNGRTPLEAWHDIDPFRNSPQSIQLFTTWEGRLKGMVLRR